MRREATLIDLDASGSAVVELDNVSQCLKCSRGEGCGAAIAGPFHGSRQQGLRLQVGMTAQLSVREGQKVIIDIEEQGAGWLLSVFGAYGLPLAGLLLGTGVATAITDSGSVNGPATSAELLVVLSALGGLAGGIFAWRVVASRVMACVERSLCLQSARIVAISPSSHREP